jgi:acetyltransferase-like isoleucine patch superfamily enzyme
MTMGEAGGVKVKDVAAPGSGSAFRKYRELVYGDLPLSRVWLCELLYLLVGSLPGALGLFLRLKLFRLIFPNIGNKVVFGRNVTFRHPHKIRLGDRVIIDDNVVLDAKGADNRGIVIGNGVYIGRNTIIYCKNGNITIGDRVNISSNCQIFSSNDLTIGPDTVIGAFTYLLSGGEYDYRSATPFSQQSGMGTKGPLRIGANCWLGAHVTVLDAASLGDRTVAAAGAVVTKPVSGGAIIGGIPARVIKPIETP